MTVTDDLTSDVAASRARIVASSNAARRALERQLHDGPQQHLVAMAVKLSLIESSIDESPDAAKAMVRDLRSEVQATVQQLRDIASAIFPPLLGDRGLAEALRAAAFRDAGQSTVDVDASAARRYSPEVEAAVYFAIVDTIQTFDGALSVSMRDDGATLRIDLVGALSEDATLHLADRVHTVGGTCRSTGTGVEVAVPIG